MSTIAVFVALGGTSYAAVTLGRGQVKSVNLANSSVTSAKVKNNSLTGGDLKNGSLTAADLSKSARTALAGPAGAPGAAGAVGAAGPVGPKGDTGPAGAAGKDGAALLRMTHRAEVTSVQSAQVVATIGGSASYSGAYSSALKIPQFDTSKTYVAVIVNASALFTSNNGTSCDLQVSENAGSSFRTVATFTVQPTVSKSGGSTSAAVPAFTPGAIWHFQLTCSSVGAVNLTEASISVAAAPLS